MSASALLIGTIAFLYPAPTNEVPTVAAIEKHLSQRYPMKNPGASGEHQFKPGTKIIEIDTPAIRRADSNLRVYRTNLSTGYFEYPQVEVAVAVWMENGILKSAECFSPTYTGESPTFIARLHGLRSKTVANREQLANEICDVFSQITHKGRIVNGRFANEEYRAELWHGKQRWRTVRVDFDSKGAISLVELIR